jgi:hypothetical protein
MKGTPPTHYHRWGIVYCITCVGTDRHYIGKTIFGHALNRWMQHKSAARRGLHGKLYDAMRLHGINAFVFQPIACALQNRYLGDLEVALIEQYDSELNGFNKIGPAFWREIAGG